MMSRQRSTRIFFLALGLMLAACSPGAGGITVIPPATSHGGPVNNYVSLIDHLRKAGATVEPAGEVEQAFFAVTGQLIRVNGADVQVFEYASEAEAAEDAEKVSPDGSAIGTTMVTWVSTPHFYRTGRLIVLYVGDDLAITAWLVGALGPQFAGGEPMPPTHAPSPTPASTPGEDTMIIGTADVEGIDILMLESFPVQVHVAAFGNLPDGCTRIGEITQAQVGNEFRVNIATVRPEHALCPLALVPFEQTVVLDVLGLPAGTYVVDVNGVTGSFELAVDNAPDY